jgi:gamma-glutamylputrescine oxidase
MTIHGLNKAAEDPRATSGALRVRGTLHGERRAEVCVVGGGYAGLSAAYHLALAGYDAVLLESAGLGTGASGRNGGQVMPGFAAEPDALIAAAGIARARALWAASNLAVAKTRALAGTACDVDDAAAIVAARDADLAAVAQAVAVRRDMLGDTMIECVGRREMARLVASPNACGGALDRRAFALDPAKYVRALSRHALEAGAAIHEDSAVLRLDRAGDGWIAQTARGRVRAANIVLAANVDIPGLAPEAQGAAVPMRTFMLETQPLDGFEAPLPGVAAGFDTSAALRYFRRTADGRLQFGAGGWPGRGSPPFAQRLLRHAFARMFPALAKARIERQWSGLVDVTPDGLPRFARADGIVRLFGFCGHGIALATLAGKLAADAIDDAGDGFELFAGLSQTRAWPTAAGRLAQIAVGRFAPSLARHLGHANA